MPQPPSDTPDSTAPDTPAEMDAVEEKAARPLVKLLLLVLCLAVFAGVLRWTPLSSWLVDFQEAKLWFQSFGHFAFLIFILICVVTLPLGMPRLVLCAIGGMLFGFNWGIVLSMFGTVLGAYVNFVAARFLGKTWGLKSPRRSKRSLARSLDNPTLVGVIVMRQMPIYGHAVNVLLGLSRCGHGTYLLGTLIGFLPQAVVAVLVGSGFLKMDAGHAMEQILGAFGMLLAVAAIATWAVKRYRANLGDDTTPDA